MQAIINCCYALLWISTASCSDFGRDKWIADFFRLERGKARLDRFKGYSLEIQFELIHYTFVYDRYLDSSLAEVIAERGESVIPFLRHKLLTDHNELVVRDVMYILKKMDLLNTYSFSDNDELLNLLYTKIFDIRDQWGLYMPEWFYRLAPITWMPPRC